MNYVKKSKTKKSDFTELFMLVRNCESDTLSTEPLHTV